MKKIIATLLMSFLVLNGSFSQAWAAQPTPPQGRTFYQVVNAYSFLVAPLATAAVGAQKGGRIGALLGLAAGCADEIAIWSGNTKKHFMTAGSLGSALTGSENQLTQLIGFLAGMFLATGKLNQLADKAGNSISTALVGVASYGKNGGIAGGVCGIVDEMLMSNQVTEAPYLSNGMYSMAAISAVTPYLAFLGSYVPNMGRVPVKHVSAALLWTYLSSGNFQVERKSPVRFADDLYALLARVIPKDKLDAMIEAQAIALVSSTVVIAKLGQKLDVYFQNFNQHREALGGTAPRAAYTASISAIWALVKFAPVFLGSHIVNGVIEGYYSDRLLQEAQDGVRGRYINEEMPLKLATSKNETALVTQMNDQLEKVTQEGAKLVSGALSSATNGAFYLMYLKSEKGLDLIVILDLYSRLQEVVAFKIASWAAGFEDPINQIAAQVSKLNEQLNAEAFLIVAADKTPLIAAKQMQLAAEHRRLKGQQLIATTVNQAWDNSRMVFDFAVKSGILASMIHSGQIKFDVRDLVNSAVGQVSSSMSWSSQNAFRMQKTSGLIGSLNKLLDKMDNETQASGKDVDYESVQGSELAIHLTDVTIGVEDQTLVNVPSHTLSKGIYAVRGQSGCGKSSFLAKIKGVRHNHAWGSGSITYVTPNGEMPKRMLVTQGDYLTPNATLLEVILSRPMSEIDVASQLPRAVALFEELEFNLAKDPKILDTWMRVDHKFGEMLSGGQKKKLAVVSAIMANPDVLILDEVFAGMDKKVIEKAQRMIKRELPNALVLVVDHHAADNNFDGFYDKELYFANHKMEELSL